MAMSLCQSLPEGNEIMTSLVTHGTAGTSISFDRHDTHGLGLQPFCPEGTYDTMVVPSCKGFTQVAWDLPTNLRFEQAAERLHSCNQ